MSAGVILMGGGIDSTSLLVWLRHSSPALSLSAFHVNYGQKAFWSESRAVDYFCKKYEVPVREMEVDLRSIASSSILKGHSTGVKQEDNKLEGRNIILIALAATWASKIGAEKVFVGFHKEPDNAPFPDATLQTYANMYIVLRTAYRPELFLEAPFTKKTRLEVFKAGLLLDEEIETKSFTCYEEGEVECGVCTHCVTKAVMLKQLEAERCAG